MNNTNGNSNQSRSVLNFMSRIPNTVIFLSFILLSFWIYQHGLAAFPRRDHNSLMMERALAGSDWNFFWNLVSYNRTRVFFPGDYFLFRPASTGLLALIDIFFRHNLYAIGAISIFSHALTSFSLFLLASKLTGRQIGLIFAGIFLTQYSGMEMVFWRHISPYMLGLTCFGLGLLQLCNIENSKKPAAAIAFTAFLFFLSSLFQETVVLALPICGLFLIFFPRQKINAERQERRNKLTKPAVAVICFLPAALFLILNAISLWYYNPSSFLGPDDIVRTQATIINIVSSIHLVSGLAAIAFFLPQIVTIDFPMLWDRGTWDFSNLSKDLPYAAGNLLLLFLVGMFVWLLLQFRRRKDAPAATAYLFAIAYLGAVITGLTLGRVALRTIEYMSSATYYFYITNYILLVIFAFLLNAISQSSFWMVHQFKRLGMFFLIVIAAMQMIFNFTRLQTTLEKREASDNAVAKTALEIHRSIHENTNFCYGGSLPQSSLDHMMHFLLYQESCSGGKQTPLYAIAKPDGTVSLSKLSAVEKQPVALDLEKGRFVQENGVLFSASPSDRLVEGEGIVLSKQSYDPILFEAVIHHSFDGGLVAGYQDPKNFLLLVLKKGSLYTHLMKNGKISPPLAMNWTFFHTDKIRLSIRKIEKEYFIFADDNIVVKLPGIASLQGKVGLYDFRTGGNRQAFSGLLIAEQKNSGGSSTTFEPVFQLTSLPLSSINIENS